MSGPEGLAGEGDRFGPYRILRRIAAGGMAEIFIARQQTLEGLERKVILKRILPELNRDEEFITMFLDEARLLASISHPNIAQAFDLGQLGEVFYLVMEYVRGPTLNTLLRAGEHEQPSGIPLKQALGITLALAEALAYVHDCVDEHGRPLQIVHRDLNPANVIISYDGAVKLIDFGIAKAATKVHQTRTEVVKGTYGYIAPEALVRAGPVDHRADVYGLGVLLYEMLVGVHPFDAGNMLQVVEAMVRGDFVRPSERLPRLPAALDALVCRCLAKRPESRVQTVRDFIDSLVGIMAAEGSVCTMRDLGDLARLRVPDAEGRDPVRALRHASMPMVQEGDGSATMRFAPPHGALPRIEEERPSFVPGAPPTLPTMTGAPRSAAPESKAAQAAPNEDSVTTRAQPLIPHPSSSRSESTSGEVPAYRPARREVPTVTLKMASSRRRISLLPLAVLLAVLGVAALGLAWSQLGSGPAPVDLKIPELLEETPEAVETPSVGSKSAKQALQQGTQRPDDVPEVQEPMQDPVALGRGVDDDSMETPGDDSGEVIIVSSDSPGADATKAAFPEHDSDGTPGGDEPAEARSVEVVSKPGGAVIFEKDVRLGKAPMAIEALPVARELEARLRGYPSLKRTLEPDMEVLDFDLVAERARRVKLRRIRRARAAKRR